MNKSASIISGRLVSLDMFRGVTIAGMILVNNPGSWGYVYAALGHAEWHGWTPTDLIFPFFLFIVGVAITLSLTKRLAAGASHRSIFLKVLRRSIILFALGLFLSFLARCIVPKFDISHIRIPGVLQRIAICYFFSTLIFVKTNWKGRAIIIALLLAFYWVMMKLYPVPGYGPGVLTLKGNLCTHIDNLILKGHMYKPNFDPEGIFSTIPAIATTLSGVLAGDWLCSPKSWPEKVVGLFVVGNFAILAGIIMDAWLPINKQLWTSSYTVFTSGMAMVCLAMCYYIIDIKGYKRWAVPFTAMGMNAIAMFVGNGLMVRLLSFWKITEPDGSQLTPLTYAYRHFFVPIAGNLNGSLLYAIVMVSIWIGIAAILYRKRIFIKI